ncbi:MAG TPA: RluA family pseudouridine synthase [Candidatus Onthousia faecavium]|nr:RluA family pseudouridine synthase [Candidatus Onthousia faecavium]
MKQKVTKEGKLLETLFVLFEDISKKKVKNYLKEGGVLVNDKVITKYNFKVKPNDTIELNKVNKTHHKSALEIIYEDNDFLVINKPAGLLSVGTNKEKEKTAYHLVREFIKNRNKLDKIFVLHRLDKDTSGVLVFVKNSTLKNILQNNWDKYVKTREYFALVSGKVIDVIDYVCYLKEIGPDKVIITNKKDGKKAITTIKTISSNNKYTLVKVNIKTGRRNQIRVVLSSLGNSIIGDKKYGNINSNRLYLHASKLTLINPLNNKTYTFKSGLPSSFKKVGNLK